MEIKYRSSVWITSRDLRLFRYLFEVKGATAIQMARDVFDSCRPETAYRRCLKLSRAGYIGMKGFRTVYSRGYIYELTKKGLSQIQATYPFEIDRPVLKSDSPDHDLKLVEIDARIRHLSCVEDYYTENVLRSCSRLHEMGDLAPFIELHSDRVLVANIAGKIRYLAIEFEHSPKAKARYKDKFRQYYEAQGVSAVLYVCSDNKLANGLMAIDDDVVGNRESLFYFCDFNSLLTATKSLTFTNTKGAKIQLN